MRTSIHLLILAVVAAASSLERRDSHETRAPSTYNSNGDYEPRYGGYPAQQPGYGGYPSSQQGYPSSSKSPSSGGRRPRYPPMPRPHPYGQPPTSTCTDEDVSPATQTTVIATSTCTEDIQPTAAPYVPSGVEDAKEVCSTATVTETKEVPVERTVTETVDRPVTETVQVTSVRVEPTTIVQPVYQTETVTCTETLPPVYQTVEKTVEHTAYVTATETVYPQPTQAVSDVEEQKPKPSAYGEKPSAYQQAPSAYGEKQSAY